MSRTRLSTFRFVRFTADRRANVAPIFALALVPVIGIMGAAVDYSRASAARAAMQAALDATALQLAKSASNLTAAQLNQSAAQAFFAVFDNASAQEVQVSATYTSSPSSVTVQASAKVPTTFMRVAGFSELEIRSLSTVRWGGKRLRVALALDTTGSMAEDGRMTELKPAAHKLLDKLRAAATKDGDVYVAIVPFSKDVNGKVSAQTVNANWIDWTEWEAPPPFPKPDANVVGPGSPCPYSNQTHGFKCTSGPANDPNCNNGSRDYSCVSRIPSSGPYAGYVCPSLDSGAKNAARRGRFYNGCYRRDATTTTNTVCTGRSCNCGNLSNCTCTGSGSSKTCTQTVTTYEYNWVANPRTSWNGCFMDREKSPTPYNTMNTTPTSDPATKFPAEQNVWCPVSLQPLTYDWTALHAKVDALTPNGNTNTTIGLAWAWQALTDGAPLDAPPIDTSFGIPTEKVIIFMTDGDNTQDRWTTNVSAMDDRMRAACSNAKAAGITIYTVLMIEGNASLLRECASDPSKFFHLTAASQIDAAFEKIGTELTRLRIAQ